MRVSLIIEKNLNDSNLDIINEKVRKAKNVFNALITHLEKFKNYLNSVKLTLEQLNIIDYKISHFIYAIQNRLISHTTSVVLAL